MKVSRKDEIENYVRSLLPDEAQIAADIIFSTYGANSTFKMVLVSVVERKTNKLPAFYLIYQPHLEEAPANIKALFDKAVEDCESNKDSDREEGESPCIYLGSQSTVMPELREYLSTLDTLECATRDGGSADVVQQFMIVID